MQSEYVRKPNNDLPDMKSKNRELSGFFCRNLLFSKEIVLKRETPAKNNRFREPCIRRLEACGRIFWGWCLNYKWKK